MKKKIQTTALICIILMSIIIIVSGCSTRPSGTFVSTEDSAITLVFNGNNVTLFENGVEQQKGTFTTSAKTSRGVYLLRITLEGSPETMYWLDETRSNIIATESVEGDGVTHLLEAGVAFVKES